MWDRRARVLSVKDGDTLRVQLDQGFGDTKTLDLRLLGAFAPEHDEPGGPETKASYSFQGPYSRTASGSWRWACWSTMGRTESHEWLCERRSIVSMSYRSWLVRAP